jgi:hypothetical protein
MMNGIRLDDSGIKKGERLYAFDGDKDFRDKSRDGCG